MKRILLYIILLFSISGFSQETHSLQFDVGLTQTHQDFFSLYDGVIEGGGAYYIGLTKNLFTGLSFHLNYLSRKNTKAKTLVYKPKINLQYFIHISRSFAIVPGLSAGYALIKLKNSEFDYRDFQSGGNVGTDLKFVWTRPLKTEFYFFGRFDFIYLKKDAEFTQLNYYRNVYLTSFGLGINIKSYGRKK